MASIDPRLLQVQPHEEDDDEDDDSEDSYQGDGEIFSIEEILDYNLRDNLLDGYLEEEWRPQGLRWEVRFHIKWKGYDSSHNTWEPRRNFNTWEPQYDAWIEAARLKHNRKPLAKLEAKAEARNEKWQREQEEEVAREKKKITGSAVMSKRKKDKGAVKKEPKEKAKPEPKKKEVKAETSKRRSAAHEQSHSPALSASHGGSRPRATRNSGTLGGQDSLWTQEALKDIDRYGNLPPSLRGLRMPTPPRRDEQGNLVASGSDSGSPETPRRPELPAGYTAVPQPGVQQYGQGYGYPAASTSQGGFAGEGFAHATTAFSLGITAQQGGFAGDSDDDDEEEQSLAAGAGQAQGIGGINEDVDIKPDLSASIGAGSHGGGFAGDDTDDEDDEDGRNYFPSLTGAQPPPADASSGPSAAKAPPPKEFGFAGSDSDEDVNMAGASTAAQAAPAPQGGFAGSDDSDEEAEEAAATTASAQQAAPAPATQASAQPAASAAPAAPVAAHACGFADLSDDDDEDDEEEAAEVARQLRKEPAALTKAVPRQPSAQPAKTAAPAPPRRASKSGPVQASRSREPSVARSRESSVARSREPSQQPRPRFRRDSMSPQLVVRPGPAAPKRSGAVSKKNGKDVGKHDERSPPKKQKTKDVEPKRKTGEVQPPAKKEPAATAQPKERAAVPPAKKKQRRAIVESDEEDEGPAAPSDPVSKKVLPSARKAADAAPAAKDASPDAASSSALSSSKAKEDADPFNHGVDKPATKDGFVIMNYDKLSLDKLDQRMMRREIKAPPHVITPADKVRHVWRLNHNILDGVADFDAVMLDNGVPREVWITEPPSKGAIGVNRLARLAANDYNALQLVLSSIEGVKQADSPRPSVSAVFVHTAKAFEIGHFPGKLTELEKYRTRDDVVCYEYGETQEGVRLFRQFWRPSFATTFTPSALIAHHERISSLLEKQKDAFNLDTGCRNSFAWVPLQYLLPGGAFGAAVDEEGNKLPPTPEEDLDKRAAKLALRILLHQEDLALVRLLPSANAPPSQVAAFPRNSDRMPLVPSAWEQVEASYPPKFCKIGIERLQKQVCAWRVQYPQMRRWLIIATPDELESCRRQPTPGIDLVTIEQAEAILAR
ncbi:hypothetical protein JCM10207_006019 [Rhodosporidiobolus poonsookiae]